MIWEVTSSATVLVEAADEESAIELARALLDIEGGDGAHHGTTGEADVRDDDRR